MRQLLGRQSNRGTHTWEKNYSILVLNKSFIFVDASNIVFVILIYILMFYFKFKNFFIQTSLVYISDGSILLATPTFVS